MLGRVGESVSTDVPGAFAWDELQQSLTFTPTEALEFGQQYAIDVSQDAKPVGGNGNLRVPFHSMFSVSPYPDVVSITPSDGAVDVLPEESVYIQFNTPVSRTQVLEQVSVSPIISTTYVYSYYSPYNQELMLSWFKEPMTQYTITVGTDIEDEYGNTLGEDRQFTFITGDYSPFVVLELDRFNHFSASEEPLPAWSIEMSTSL